MTTDKNKWKTKGIKFKKVIDPITKETIFEDGSVPINAIDPELIKMITGLTTRVSELQCKVDLLKGQLMLTSSASEIAQTIKNTEVK